MALTIEQGADIVIRQWCRIRPTDKVLIVTDDTHTLESQALWASARSTGAFVSMVTVPPDCSQQGSIFDTMVDYFCINDVIIGATNFSLLTTRAVKQLLLHGKRFLSLPLSTKDGRSALTYEFMRMSPQEAKELAEPMLAAIQTAKQIRITTPLGTDLTFGKQGRDPGLFRGVAEVPGQAASSSFEIYLGIEETKTNGHAVVDASLGYIGIPRQPIHLDFADGRLVQIEDTACGQELRAYMERFQDKGIYVAGELGIGLNKLARCEGNCYIEDESTFGTFHIGMGRNLAFGGVHDAAGHFDFVFYQPTIYADDVLIMKDGLSVFSS